MKSLNSLSEDYKKQEIQDILGPQDSMLFKHDMAKLKALLWIYNNQEPEEKADGYTKIFNGIGFTGIDGKILSSFAEFFKKNYFLSPKQMEILRKKMPKYWKQMLWIANAELKDKDTDYVIKKWIENNKLKYRE